MVNETAAPAVEISPSLAAQAKQAGWPEDLVQELLQRGAQPADLVRYMGMGVTAEQVRQFDSSSAWARSFCPVCASVLPTLTEFPVWTKPPSETSFARRLPPSNRQPASARMAGFRAIF